MQHPQRRAAKPPRIPTALAALVMAGCPTTVSIVDVGGGPPAGNNPPCEPALNVEPQNGMVETQGLRTLTASGGTGNYRFYMDTNESGALVNERTGAYLAGTLAGARDTLRLEDTECVGQALAEIDVVDPMVVRPTEIEVALGTPFSFEITGGSGSYACSISNDGAGGSVTSQPCSYNGASVPGVDIIRVADEGTGQVVEVPVHGAQAPELVLEPELLFLPIGSSFELGIHGGSGVLETTDTDGTSASWDGNLVVGSEPGTTSLTLTDRFSGLTAELKVEVVVSQEAPMERYGLGYLGGTILAPGDVTGDGYPDALLGLVEAHVGAYLGGALFLYEGGPDGLDPDPVSFWAGYTWEEFYGGAAAVGDFDSDGFPDLAVGGASSDRGANNSGAVDIFPGRSEGGFQPNPTVEMVGRYGGDGVGAALASCDFNGDGFEDLVIGAPTGENRAIPYFPANQGMLSIHLGSETGLSPSPDQVVYVQLPGPDGEFYGVAGLQGGSQLATGDFDGDGRCDLAAAGWQFTTGPGQGSDGIVLLYQGLASSDGIDGGIMPEPSMIWMGDPDSSANSQFGWSISLGDLDQDGRDDLAVGQRQLSVEGVPQAGGVQIFRGRELEEGPAEWIYYAELNTDWFYASGTTGALAGTSVDLADFTGDGMPDLIVSAPADQLSSGPNEAGTIVIYEGNPEFFSEFNPSAFRLLVGEEEGGWFGQMAKVVGDTDQDGSPDMLVFSGRENHFGHQVGAPWFVPGRFGPAWHRLDYPGDAAGMQFGTAAALVGDYNGDGNDDLITSAINYDDIELGQNAGGVWLHLGDSGGVATDASIPLMGFPGHGSGDQLGRFVRSAGDFDNDGNEDVVVVTTNESLPGSFDPELYVNLSSCPEARNNPGVAYIFRGRDDGLVNTVPSFVYYGPEAGARFGSVAGEVDINGDGFDDLVFGIPGVDLEGFDRDGNRRVDGGATVAVFGRGAYASGIRLICFPSYALPGDQRQEGLGGGVTGIGDVDGDGCDEFAAGAPGYDFIPVEGDPVQDQGAVHIIWGFGGTGCPADAQVSSMRSYVSRSRAGDSLAGGGDLDGDGYPDLVIGGPTARVDGNSAGAVWVVPSSYMQNMPRSTPQAATTDDWLPFAISAGRLRLQGEVTAEGFGTDLALLPGVEADGRAVLAIGSPGAEFSGGLLSGGARIYRFNPDESSSDFGLYPHAWAALGGETNALDSRLGTVIDAGELNGAPALVVGGNRGDGVFVDSGSVYVMKLDTPEQD